MKQKTPSPLFEQTKYGMKAIDFEAFGGLDGFFAATSDGGDGNSSILKRIVPYMGHAVSMTGNAVSDLPFDFVDEKGAVIDASTDWMNKTGGIKDPKRLMYLVASSLCGGSAYLLPTFIGNVLHDLQYCAPSTVVPNFDNNGELVDFSRNGKTLSTEEVIYFWLPDSDVELGPALTHPLGNARMAAELLASMSGTLKIYGDRGFVPNYFMGVDGMTQPDKEKAENALNLFLRGLTKNVVKFFNSSKATPIKIGAGLEELKGVYTEIVRQQIEAIGAAFGISAGLFMSDAAYATEMEVLTRMWYSTGTYKSIYHTIEETMTMQLLIPHFKQRMQYKPETLDVFQDSNKTQIELWSVLVANKVPNSLAAKIAGVNLPAGVTPEMLDPKEEPAQTPVPVAPEPSSITPEPTPAKAFTLTAAETKDLALWQQMATRFFQKGKPLPVDFECKALPASIADPIRQKLMKAGNAYEVEQAFVIGADERTEPQVITALYMAVKAMELKK